MVASTVPVGGHDWTRVRRPQERTFRPTSTQHEWRPYESWDVRANKAVTLVIPTKAADQLQEAANLITNVLGSGVLTSALPGKGEAVQSLCETVEDFVHAQQLSLLGASGQGAPTGSSSDQPPVD